MGIFVGEEKSSKLNPISKSEKWYVTFIEHDCKI
jgi:hypothetical protein